VNTMLTVPYDYRYLSKSQHTDNVQIDDIDKLRITEDAHITYEIISDIVDELVKFSTPTLEESISEDALVKSSTPHLMRGEN